YKWAGNPRAPLGVSIRLAPPELAHQRVDRVDSLNFDCWIKIRRLSPALQKAPLHHSRLRWRRRNCFNLIRGIKMPEKKTIERAERDKREGKAPSTQAGEFVHEEIEHIREGKHGARSTKQAIAIGLSKARRAGVKLAPPKKGTTSPETRRKAERDLERGQKGR